MNPRPTLWRRRAVVPLLMSGMLLLASCGDDAEDPSEPGATTTVAPPDDGGSEGDASEGDASDDRATDERNGVEVLEAGAEPRARLLLAPEAGTELERTLAANIGITLQVDGQELPSPPLPGTRLVLRSLVDEVSDDSIATTFTFVDVAAVGGPEIDPAVLDQTNSALEPLRGLSGTGTSDRHGGSQEVSLDTSTISDPALRSTLDSLTSQLSSLTAPLPAQPVGAGASWRVERSAVLNGIQTDTATTYTLQSHSGNDYVLAVTQDATAPPGPAELPGLPAGVTTTIDSFLLRSDGEVRGRLDQPLPDSSTIMGSGDVELTVTGEGETGTLLQQLTIDISLG